MPRRKTALAWLVLLVLPMGGGVQACSLNPQPLPPIIEPDTNAGAASDFADSGASHESSQDAGKARDAARALDGVDGGIMGLDSDAAPDSLPPPATDAALSDAGVTAPDSGDVDGAL